MDFPVFHLDGMGNRMLIATIAVLHLVINHALAVGAIPLITSMEWYGYRTGDARWDDLAHRVLNVCFIITTTVGALTGVGIWLSVSLVNPSAIASLIRVFFWAWFAEWLVFVTEVCLILAYYLLWDKWGRTNKVRHIRLGMALSLFSWITMSLIVAILGFMMDPGAWQVGASLSTAIFNPIYLPQLAFRTTLAMVEAGLFCWMLTSITVPEGEFRQSVVRYVSRWTLCWSPLLFFGAVWYRSVVPESMATNLPVAIGTQQGADWYGTLLWLTVFAVVVIFGTAIVGLRRPNALTSPALAIPFLLSVALMGQFERVREFIRKPYVIAGYMFANGIREHDVALLQRDGILKHAAYCSTREVFPRNRLAAGQDVFRLACTRCHTTGGMNGIVAKFERLNGDKPWNAGQMADFIENMHGARPYMPPFPGNRTELDALMAYVVSLRAKPRSLGGDQIVGVDLPIVYTEERKFGLWSEVLADAGQTATDRQASLRAIAALDVPGVDRVLSERFDQLERGQAPAELALDIVEAAKLRRNPDLVARAAGFERKLDADASLDRFRLSMAGGDSTRGSTLFRTKTCVTCHKIDGAGAEVGPDLSKVGARSTRDYLLESIVAPAAKIAKGYESVTVVKDDGTTVQGLVRRRDEKELTLKTAAGQEVVIPLSEIDEEVGGQTLMPTGIFKTLSRAELRDLIEYLATRR